MNRRDFLLSVLPGVAATIVSVPESATSIDAVPEKRPSKAGGTVPRYLYLVPSPEYQRETHSLWATYNLGGIWEPKASLRDALEDDRWPMTTQEIERKVMEGQQEMDGMAKLPHSLAEQERRAREGR